MSQRRAGHSSDSWCVLKWDPDVRSPTAQSVGHSVANERARMDQRVRSPFEVDSRDATTTRMASSSGRESTRWHGKGPHHSGRGCSNVPEGGSEAGGGKRTAQKDTTAERILWGNRTQTSLFDRQSPVEEPDCELQMRRACQGTNGVFQVYSALDFFLRLSSGALKFSRW